MPSVSYNEIVTRLAWMRCFVQATNTVDSMCSKIMELNITQCRIMFHVSIFPNEPIGNIASSLFLKPSTATAAVNSMVERGLISKVKNNIDQRNVCIQLTPSGVSLSTSYIETLEQTFASGYGFALESKRDLLRVLLCRSSVIDIDKYKARMNSLVDNKDDYAGLGNYSNKKLDYFLSHALSVENMCYFLARLNSLAKNFDLTPNEFRILLQLSTFSSPVSMKEISESVNVRPNVCTVSLNKLSGYGLIIRHSSNLDRRVASIKLSSKGNSLVKKSIESFVDLFDSCFPDLVNYELVSFVPDIASDSISK